MDNILYLSDSYGSKAGDSADTNIGSGTDADSATDIEIRTNSNTYLDLKVLVINLNGCYNDDIKRNCRTLADYQTYVSLIREYAKNFSIEDAVEKAIDECIKRGVLKEFLEKERAEIMSLSIYEFDKEREFRIVREDVMKLGLEEGLAKGRQEGIKLGRIESFVKQAIKYGETKEKAIEDASVEFGVTKEYIEDVMERTKQP